MSNTISININKSSISNDLSVKEFLTNWALTNEVMITDLYYENLINFKYVEKEWMSSIAQYAKQHCVNKLVLVKEMNDWGSHRLTVEEGEIVNVESEWITSKWESLSKYKKAEIITFTGDVAVIELRNEDDSYDYVDDLDELDFSNVKVVYDYTESDNFLLFDIIKKAEMSLFKKNDTLYVSVQYKSLRELTKLELFYLKSHTSNQLDFGYGSDFSMNPVIMNDNEYYITLYHRDQELIINK